MKGLISTITGWFLVGFSFLIESGVEVGASVAAIIASGAGAYYYITEARLKNAQRRKLEKEMGES